MSKVLYIKANPKSEEISETFKISEKFIEEYKKVNSEDEIVTIDLYKEDIDFLRMQDLQSMMSGEENKAMKYAKDFTTYDKVIIAAPMWNLGIPAILKAYIDYVVYAGITFKYTENGSVGLLKDKNMKIAHIVARGGEYDNELMVGFENGDRYIRSIFGFIGVDDITTIAFDNTSTLSGEALELSRNEKIVEAKHIAEQF